MCWVYFTIDCVSINYTIFAAVLILWIIVPVDNQPLQTGRLCEYGHIVRCIWPGLGRIPESPIDYWHERKWRRSDVRANLISLDKQQKSKLHQHLIWNVNFMSEYKPTCLCSEQHFNDYKMPSSETPISLLYHTRKLQSINLLLSYLMIVPFPECTWHVCLIRARSQQCWLLELWSVFFFF